ncbi:MAG: MATE family efflux transporter [Clostridia bacterium]|nr:MATE family efflux transporter [Clostridia bacterium]
MQNTLLAQMREGKPLTTRQQILMIVQLSIPTILAQISSIIMQYIDASMVGQLGANDSASIGLVSSSTWLFGGVCSAAATGFTVLVAQYIGANRLKTARNIMKQSFVVALGFSLLLALAGAAISSSLPHWLGGAPEICANASWYFLIYALALPAMQLNNLAGGLLQSSGNMRVPSLLHILMCALDVVFNLVLIFPTQTILGITVPGANLGVAGAALGTALARAVTAVLMLYFLLARSPMLKLQRGERLSFQRDHLLRAAKIAIPVGFEQVVMCGAQVMSTRIVSPLGTVSIAANSFAVTAESLCYMPGYGIGAAASTLIGQGIGAGRRDLTRRLGWLTTLLGMAVMIVTGALMFIFAPWMIGILSPDPDIVALGTQVLRIEAFAEAMYAASIVASGVFRGAGDTLVPSCLNFLSMWAVRIPLSALLAPRFGLHGVWIGMCVELNVRGILFLIRLAGKRWMKSAAVSAKTA